MHSVADDSCYGKSTGAHRRVRLGAHLQEVNRLPEGLGNKWYAGPPEEEAHESVTGCAKSEQFVRHDQEKAWGDLSKIQPPGPGAEKTQPPRPVPPRKKNTTAPSRLGKKKNALSRFGKKNDRPVPLGKKKNAPSRLEKKTTVPSRQEFPPLYFASPALPPK